MFREDIVTAHVQRASEAMRWGIDDCCQFVRDVVRSHGGPDIMAGFPAYHSKIEAEAVMTAKGGFVRAVMAQADGLGLAECFAPFPTDRRLVGIVPTARGPALALMIMGRWVVRAHHGVVVMAGESAVMAWEV